MTIQKAAAGTKSYSFKAVWPIRQSEKTEAEHKQLHEMKTFKANEN